MHTGGRSLAFFVSGLLFLFSQGTHAALSCPWQNHYGVDFFKLDVKLGQEKSLTANQIQEDLDCLRILLTNVYSYGGIDNDHLILKRLADLSRSAKPSSNTEFVNQIFSLHLGFIDTHLSYQAGNSDHRFSGIQNPRVKLSEDLKEGKIINRGQFVYFRTGEVPSPITKTQNDFIQLVREQDRNLIIDLRGNGGGDDGFAHELAKVLFTADEALPRTTKNDLLSPLANIGFCLSLAISYGPEMGGAKEQCNQIRASVSNLPFRQLLPRTHHITVDSIEGERPASYKSKIYLITDQTCASSCETIVEKLSAHPKVITIGQRTYGALHYSNPGIFVLPHSETLIRLPTLRQEYENDAGEGLGYQPKIQTAYIDLDSLSFQTH